MILLNKSLCSEMGGRSRVKVTEFDLTKIAAELEALYIGLEDRSTKNTDAMVSAK